MKSPVLLVKILVRLSLCALFVITCTLYNVYYRILRDLVFTFGVCDCQTLIYLFVQMMKDGLQPALANRGRIKNEAVIEKVRVNE